jgi:hypothetical protein
VRRSKRILLVEPAYRNKFPPMGLMKIATYHSLLGDAVRFCKGTSVAVRDERWDRVYIATLFTFHWRLTVDTIRFYQRGNAPVVTGGILATLMPEKLEEAVRTPPHVGPLVGDIPKLTDAISGHAKLELLRDELQQRGIDALPPDYGVFDGVEVPYRDTLDSCYLLRSSRGCIRKCDFCAVPALEPTFVERVHLTPAVDYIAAQWGERRNLVLLDDNVLASRAFNEIIDEIRDLGFSKGARLDGRLRSVDFNQGLDIRLLTKPRLRKLAAIALRPLRVAFDDIALTDRYSRLLEEAHDAGFTEISSYVLYNHRDKPEDLYARLQAACQLNSRLSTRIYSFPMKYIPCSATDRTFLGDRWTRRQIRGVQCILNASHGISPRDPAFFARAFGSSVGEFLDIIQMPEDYIIGRSRAEIGKKATAWKKCLGSLSSAEREEALAAVSRGKGTITHRGSSKRVRRFLDHYSGEYPYCERG